MLFLCSDDWKIILEFLAKVTLTINYRSLRNQVYFLYLAKTAFTLTLDVTYLNEIISKNTTSQHLQSVCHPSFQLFNLRQMNKSTAFLCLVIALFQQCAGQVIQIRYIKFLIHHHFKPTAKAVIIVFNFQTCPPIPAKPIPGTNLLTGTWYTIDLKNPTNPGRLTWAEAKEKDGHHVLKRRILKFERVIAHWTTKLDMVWLSRYKWFGEVQPKNFKLEKNTGPTPSGWLSPLKKPDFTCWLMEDFLILWRLGKVIDWLIAFWFGILNLMGNVTCR